MNLEEGRKGWRRFFNTKTWEAREITEPTPSEQEIGDYLYPNKDSSAPPIPKHTTHAPADKNKKAGRTLKDFVQNQ